MVEHLARRSGARPKRRKTISPLGSSTRVSSHATLKHSFQPSPHAFPTLSNLLTTKPCHSSQKKNIGNFGCNEHRRRKFLALSRHRTRSEGQHRFLDRYASFPNPFYSSGNPRALQRVGVFSYVIGYIPPGPEVLPTSSARYMVLVSWKTPHG